MTAPPLSFASLPHGSRPRNWTNSEPSRLRPSRRPIPTARLRPSPKALVRFAHAWSRSSSPGLRPPTGRHNIAASWHARPNSRPRSRGFKLSCVFASSNSSVEKPRPPPRPSRRSRFCHPHQPATASAPRPAARQAGAQTTRLFPPPGHRRGPPTRPRSVPLLAVRSPLQRLPGHRGFDHSRSRRPRSSPDHPPPTLSAHLLVCRPSRPRHRTAPAPTDPQVDPGGVDLGGPAPG